MLTATGLSGAMVILTLGVILSGHVYSEPNELQVMGLVSCGDRPCFMGIVPGVTKWDQAVTQLVSQGAIEDDYTASLALFLDNGLIANFFRTDSNSPLVELDTTNYMPRNEHPNVAQLITAFGVPCSILLHRDMRYALIQYPRMTATITLDRAAFNVHTQISEIEIYDVPDAHRCAVGSVSGYASLPWMGFASANRYALDGLLR